MTEPARANRKTIQSVRLYHLEIPFKQRFSHHLATRSTSASIMLELTCSDGSSHWGECLPREYVTGEQIDGTLDVLERVSHALIGASVSDVLSVDAQGVHLDGRIEQGVIGAPSARCALELALLDGLSYEREQTLSAMLGGFNTDELLYSVVVSSETPQAVEALLARAAPLNMSHIKLKVGASLEDDLTNVASCFRLYGQEVKVRVDANGVWSLPQAIDSILKLADAGVTSFEQPLAAENHEAYRTLRDAVGEHIHLVVDESIASMDDARWFVEHQVVSGFNLKISKLGGLGPSLVIHDMAQRVGMSCQLGAHVGETSLMTAAGALFAGVTGDLLFCEGGYTPYLMSHDICARPWTFGSEGRLALAMHTGLGLGVDVDRVLVEQSNAGSHVIV